MYYTYDYIYYICGIYNNLLIYICTYVCLYISEMNGDNDTRDGMEELELFCYYEVLSLPTKKYSVMGSGF